MKEGCTHLLLSEKTANFNSDCLMGKKATGKSCNEMHTWKSKTQSIHFSTISNQLLLHHY